MNTENLKQDDYGRLLAKGIHDATILEINLRNSHREVDIKTSSLDGKISVINITNVEFMSLNNIWGSEIVDSIYFWRLQDISLKHSLTQKDAMKMLFLNRVDIECENFFDHLKKKYPNFFLIYIESSYGGNISIICKNFSFAQS